MTTLERTKCLTEDGSPTLYVSRLDEHYHSTKGALVESQHIYINCGLRHYATKNEEKHTSEIRILEFGFGTGLNALQTALCCDDLQHRLEYETLELYPLSANESDEYASGFITDDDELNLYKQLHSTPWNERVPLTATMTLHKRNVDFRDAILNDNYYDVVYFDAFAPEKQAELWTNEIFEKIFKAMRFGGILTTYCAKGSVRRSLLACGFTVERLEGPPGGKREILRATKPFLNI